jgi:predicted enzyme related to lactoylglutathione lyase
MRKIDWNEILEFYNRVFGLNIKTAKTMRRHCYKKFGSLEEAANKLGISSETLRLKIIEDGMAIVNQILGEICKDIDEKDHDNKPKIAKIVRQKAKITCRELSTILGFTIGQISDIEHGRFDVSDDAITAWFMVCASKIIVQREMGKINE